MSVENIAWLNAVAFLPLAVLGSLLHFAYDWSKHNRFVAVFAAVNESYWEHIKIAFWPVLFWCIAIFALGGWKVPGFIPAVTITLYAVPIAMIAIVVTYKAIARRNVLWIDILAFFLTIAIALAVFTLVVTELAARPWTVGLSCVFLVVLAVAFTRFTLRPPTEPDLFVDPLNQRYGLEAHSDNS